MRYVYDFGFFGEWLTANPQIKKNAILKALGIKADNGMRKWAEGRYPMPVISMLRLCNGFNIPLSAFIKDMDAKEGGTVIPVPSIDNQLEPNGGYIRQGEERMRGESTIHDPLDVKKIESVVPRIEPLDAPYRDVVTEEEPHKTAPEPEEKPEPLHQAVVHTAAVDIDKMIELETIHKKQTDRLLTIIEEQQRQIDKLTSMISRDARPYEVIREYGPDEHYGMAAEDRCPTMPTDTRH